MILSRIAQALIKIMIVRVELEGCLNEQSCCTSSFSSFTHQVTHGADDACCARAVDAATEWKEEAGLTAASQVVPQPQRRTETEMRHELVEGV